MKKFIKRRLNEMLQSTEIGGKSDIEMAKVLPLPPYERILWKARESWGQDSDFYQDLASVFLRNKFNYNDLLKVLHEYDMYDEFSALLGLNETMIDGQSMDQGTQTACNTMSVATYAEGIKLIIAAIGKPNENPALWQKIQKPLSNWKQENTSIGKEVNTGGMSGDSMVDESNTWWAAIQSTICEQGNNFQ